MRFQTTALIGSLCVLGLAGHANAGLTAHYTLDAIDGGTTATDSTGNADGTLNGTGISVVAGAIGNAYDFTGAGTQFVSIDDPAIGKTAFTASVWFNPDSLGNQGTVSQWSNGSGQRSFLIRTSGSTLQTFARSGATQIGGSTSFSTESLTTAGFNHVVYSYDGQNVRTYLNGELSTTVHNFASAGTILGEGSPGSAAIGGRGSSEQNTNGLIDDVAFWDETLTNDEVIGLSQVAGINYNASQFQQLKAIHDAGSGSVKINGTTWAYQTNLSGSAGLNEAQNALVLDDAADTGLVNYTVRVDFNSDSNGSLSDTQTGWLGTDAAGNGTDGTYTVTTTAVGGGTVDDRDRGTGNGGGDEADMWNDFIFSNDNSTGTTKGLQITVSGLEENTEYPVTIWGFDASSGSPAPRAADWSAEIGDTATLSFDASGTGPGLPTDLTSNYVITINATSNADGEIILTGLPASPGGSNNHDVFINGLEIGVPEPSSLALLGLGGLLLSRSRR